MKRLSSKALCLERKDIICSKSCACHSKNRKRDRQIGCEDTKRGHILATKDDYEFGLHVGQCYACGKAPHSADLMHAAPETTPDQAETTGTKNHNEQEQGR